MCKVFSPKIKFCVMALWGLGHSNNNNRAISQRPQEKGKPVTG